MATPAEEIGVVARHLGVMASLAGLLAVALQACLLIKGPHLAMGMRPLWTLVRLWLGLLVTSLTLLLGMAVQAHPFLDPLGFTAMGLLEVRTAVPFGRFLTADPGVTKGAVVRIATSLPKLGEERSVIAAYTVGHQHTARGLLVALHAGFSIPRNRRVVEVKLIHLLRFHNRHIHPGLIRDLFLTVCMAQDT